MSTLKPEQLDALLQGYKNPAELEPLYSQLLQRMINRGLEAEMGTRLGYGHGERSESGNSRNGKSRKRVQNGELDIACMDGGRGQSPIALHWPPKLEPSKV